MAAGVDQDVQRVGSALRVLERLVRGDPQHHRTIARRLRVECIGAQDVGVKMREGASPGQI